MTRFFSTVARPVAAATLMMSLAAAGPGRAIAQVPGATSAPGAASLPESASGYYTNPDTGIVYRKVTRTVETPVTETRMQKQTQTVYKPQTVTETRPVSRTVYTPIIENRWEPRVHGRWNPFVQPTIQYHAVPQTHWTSRQETIQSTQTKTQWVPENRTVEIPTQLTRIERQQKVDFEPVGKVAPPAAAVDSAIASRLRPLAPGTKVDPVGGPLGSPAAAIAMAPPVYQPPQIAASTVGRLTSDPPRRTLSQGGLRANELVPARRNYGSMLR